MRNLPLRKFAAVAAALFGIATLVFSLCQRATCAPRYLYMT